MHRRAFIANLSAATLLPRTLHAQTPAAIPVATPAVPSSRPAPIDLGSGVSLIDYRPHPGDPGGIIGELRNDSDQTIDAPVVSLRWSRPGQDEGFSWLSPMIPVIDASASIPIYGPVPDGERVDAMLTDHRFALCSPAEPGEYTTLAQDMEVEITPTDEATTVDAYLLKGTITNTGATTARHCYLRGIVRDAAGRVAGMANPIHYAAIVAGGSYAFSLYAFADPELSNDLNPFPLLEGTSYTVEPLAGPRGPVTSPGCVFGMPWE